MEQLKDSETPATESSDEEEDILVFCHFTDFPPDAESLMKAASNLKIVAADTDTPMVDFSPHVYKGTWTECVGTKVLLEENKVISIPIDPVFSSSIPSMYDVKYKITKVLELSRILPKAQETHDNLQTKVKEEQGNNDINQE